MWNLISLLKEMLIYENSLSHITFPKSDYKVIALDIEKL